MGGQENFIKMKPKPIPKELINKIELRVEDIEIPPKELYGFKGYFLKNVLVPYVKNKRIGWFNFSYYGRGMSLRENPRYQIKYKINSCIPNNQFTFSRTAYIMLNKDDPRVIETEDHFDIIDNLFVDHIEDIGVQDNKFIIKPDAEKNLQLLTQAENLGKSVKRMNNLPKHIHFRPQISSWCFEVKKSIKNKKDKAETFAIIKNSWEGAFIKAIDCYNQHTGDNYIPNLDDAIPDEFKGMTEREFYEEYSSNFKRKRKINPNNQLDLGLSLT